MKKKGTYRSAPNKCQIHDNVILLTVFSSENSPTAAELLAQAQLAIERARELVARTDANLGFSESLLRFLQERHAAFSSE